MSHTHFLYHIVFATKDRMPMIGEWEAEVYKYLSGIVRNHGGVLLAIGGTPDHVHMLVRLGPCDFAAFMRELKASSSKWAKRHQPKFSWQRRYGAFTVSESVEDKVRRYILDQKAHHGKQSFEDEYKALLTRHRIQFDEKHLWD